MKQGVMQRFDELSVGQKRSIGLVLTGGTIGSQHDDVLSVSENAQAVSQEDTSLRHAAEVKLLTEAWKGSETLELQVRSPLRLLSENLQPKDWVPISQAARDLAEIQEVAGIVVFHGTDTMAYTAAALSFLLHDLDKPVVLTGSNLPPDQEGSDAVHNAHDALVALQHLPAGTFIVFAGANNLPSLVHPGTRARKLQASGQAYATINGGPLAEVAESRFVWNEPLPQRLKINKRFKCAIDPRVLALRLYPGLDFAAASSAVASGGVRGVVVELYASATGPDTGDQYSLPKFIERCGEQDVPVITTVNTSPDEPGNVYETTISIAKAGALFLEGMLPETATAKLMWALAQSDDMAIVKELMRTPIAGEL